MKTACSLTKASNCFILTMWYVNVLLPIMNIGYSLCFILTMWYVNYSLPYVPGSYDWGFILTMWYVNFVQLLS
ncbi:hypothetical protein DA424_08840 [Clostridioides difficile]|nr:hypothetical protein [Clostridioides difficile]TOY63340.1 hypothetical protein DA424_08840 [Clostridioides difficile]